MTAPFSAVIIGGSVGGLATAIELRDRLGADVAVYERSSGEMQARGAGVVMQPEVDALLHSIGVETPSLCVELKERVGLALDGRYSVNPAPQLMTAWDALYRVLRKHLGDDCYRQGSELVGLTRAGDHVEATFADGHNAAADILVGADGVNSKTRALVGGPPIATYTGYVAWRGLEAETALPPKLIDALRDRFTSYMHPGMQMLCYLVPGADGSNEVGKRRVNWVWYVNTPEPDLSDLMMGTSGTSYRSFLPKDDLSTATEKMVNALAKEALPPLFRELVLASDVFMQPVQDVAPQRRRQDRVFLIGDAAGTVRPHTAAGTSKAFGDASMLAEALEGWTAKTPLSDTNLEAWETVRMMDLRQTAHRGHRLAAASGLGVD